MGAGALDRRVICGDLKKQAVLAGAKINALAILGILPHVYDQTITMHQPGNIHSGPGQWASMQDVRDEETQVRWGS